MACIVAFSMADAKVTVTDNENIQRASAKLCDLGELPPWAYGVPQNSRAFLIQSNGRDVGIIAGEWVGFQPRRAPQYRG